MACSSSGIFLICGALMFSRTYSLWGTGVLRAIVLRHTNTNLKVSCFPCSHHKRQCLPPQVVGLLDSLTSSVRFQQGVSRHEAFLRLGGLPCSPISSPQLSLFTKISSFFSSSHAGQSQPPRGLGFRGPRPLEGSPSIPTT